MNKNVWLSGSRGFIGSYVANSLRSAGYSLRCLSNAPSADANIIYTDFSDRNHIRETIDKYGVPDTFIHLGWGNVYQSHDSHHLTTNLQNGIHLVDELYCSGTDRFVLIGSCLEYGDRTGPQTENLGPEGAINNYAKGKAALAKYGLDAAEQQKKKFIHVRLFYTYGIGQKHNSLINQLFRSYMDRKAISLSPCDYYRDYIHVSDVAEGIKQICNVNCSAIINLGSGNTIQQKEFVKLMWKQLGADPELLLFGAHEKPAHEQIHPNAYADLSNLINLTGWRPSLSIEEGIKKTVAQLLANE